LLLPLRRLVPLSDLTRLSVPLKRFQPRNCKKYVTVFINIYNTEWPIPVTTRSKASTAACLLGLRVRNPLEVGCLSGDCCVQRSHTGCDRRTP
jgi:hypothetical protein